MKKAGTRPATFYATSKYSSLAEVFYFLPAGAEAVAGAVVTGGKSVT